MWYLVVIATYAAFAHGAPQGPRQWEKHSHPGWRFPKVYTPEPPSMTWYSRTLPGPASTSYEVSPTPTTPASTSAPSLSVSESASLSASVSSPANSSGPANNACAEVSRSVKGKFTISSGLLVPTNLPTVPAGVAYDCINSVPFNSSAAVELIDSIRPYLDWQTTLSYVAEPPEEYAAKVQAPFDFYAEYERIYNKARTDGYASEYEFGFDLYRVFQRVHDGHFVYYPDSVSLFSFGRSIPLVSVSRDGQEAPEVYVYADVLGASFGNITYTPSPLVSIDGQDAIEYLLEWAQYGSLQDRDALWNNVFYNLAQVSLGEFGSGLGTFAGAGRGRFIYPGPSTTLEFANGSSITTENYAIVAVPFDGVQSGADVYRKFFTLPFEDPKDPQEIVSSSSSFVVPSSSAFSSSSSAAATTTVPAPGYPTPFITGEGNLNSGYFLEGKGYDDVAVLRAASFSGLQNFQSVNTYIINEAVNQGKKKLIIDVSANGGGFLLQGFDLFKQLFPSILPYGANRFIVHEAFNLIGDEISWYSSQVPRSEDLNITAGQIVGSFFNYRTDLDARYRPFTDWDDKNGPHLKGPDQDPYTDLIRFDLSDVLNPVTGGITVSGYGDRANITEQPFPPENIIIVTDGYCASTCATFVELMRRQAGVQTVALGGRQNKDPIQAVGGVKGSQSLDYGGILYYVEKPFQIQHFNDGDYYADTALGEYSDLPFYRGLAYGNNIRDSIAKGDRAGVPLQFVYEAAECRINYTPAMAVDQSEVWRAVADSAFNSQNQCVVGGLNGASTKTKRGVKPRHQQLRRDLGAAEHYKAMARRWVPDAQKIGGDCVMIV